MFVSYLSVFSRMSIFESECKGTAIYKKVGSIAYKKGLKTETCQYSDLFLIVF